MTNQPIDIVDNGEQEQVSLAAPKKKWKKALIIIACVFLGLVLVITSTVLILINTGKKKLVNNTGIAVEETESITVDEDIVTYNGEEYRLNKNITSILVMGIDKRDITVQSEIGDNGQADTIFLVCLDTKTREIKMIPISRETMVDFDRFNTHGEYAGVKNGQICLSYAYGSDAKSGSENVKNAVSRLLCGISINSSVAIDLSGIAPLTDAVGGITLTSLETVGTFEKGKEVTLTGKNALSYVQLRGDDVEANNRRQARQKQFLKSFATKAGNKILADFTKLVTYYNTAAPYITSDLDLSEITYLAKTCLSKDIGNKVEYITISGETKMGEKYVEFYADENSVYEAVLNAFYIKID